MTTYTAHDKKRDSSVNTVTGWGGTMEFDSRWGGGGLFLHKCIRTSSGAHTATYPMGTWSSFFRNQSGMSMKLITNLQQVPRTSHSIHLIKRGGISTFHTACVSIKSDFSARWRSHTQQLAQAVNASILHLGDTRLDSRPGHRLTWGFSRFYSVLPGKVGEVP
jgi:hypothetical protein